MRARPFDLAIFAGVRQNFVSLGDRLDRFGSLPRDDRLALRHAPHHGDVDLLVQPAELVLDFLRELDEIDVGATARGARDEREAALPEAERLEDVDPDPDFLGRIRGERDADRVADALSEERAKADRRLDRADAGRARLRHTQVKRVVDLVGELAVRLDQHARVRGLQRDLHLRIVAVLKDPDMPQCRLDHALGGRPAVLGEKILLERARVDADADGDLLLLGDVHDLLHELLAADVSGVEAQAVDALLQRDERQLVVEVDVRHERDADLPLDLAELLGGLADGHRTPDDVAAGRLERPDLEQRRLDVARVGLRHRLHGERRVAADFDIAQPALPRRPPSSIGTGRRFSRARFTLMIAVNTASEAAPSFAWRPASAAIWIGPPMFEESICRETIFQRPLAVSRVMSHVLTQPYAAATSGW